MRADNSLKEALREAEKLGGLHQFAGFKEIIEKGPKLKKGSQKKYQLSQKLWDIKNRKGIDKYVGDLRALGIEPSANTIHRLNLFRQGVPQDPLRIAPAAAVAEPRPAVAGPRTAVTEPGAAVAGPRTEDEDSISIVDSSDEEQDLSTSKTTEPITTPLKKVPTTEAKLPERVASSSTNDISDDINRFLPIEALRMDDLNTKRAAMNLEIPSSATSFQTPPHSGVPNNVRYPRSVNSEVSASAYTQSFHGSQQTGSKENPYILHVDLDNGCYNHPFHITLVKDLKYGDFKQPTYFIRCQIEPPDLNCWDATVCTSTEEPAILVRGPALAHWLESTDLYIKKVRAQEDDLAVDQIEEAMNAQMLRLRNQGSKLLMHWKLIFPAGTQLDNTTYSQGDLLKRYYTAIGRQKSTTEFSYDISGMIVTFVIGDYCGKTLVRDLNSAPDKSKITPW